MEGLKAEVAEFGIDVTLIDRAMYRPGSPATSGSPPPCRSTRPGRSATCGSSPASPGPSTRRPNPICARSRPAIIAVAEVMPGAHPSRPRPDAYDYIHEALTARLTELESLKGTSYGVAVDGPAPAVDWR